jgi:hypothetical protein
MLKKAVAFHLYFGFAFPLYFGFFFFYFVFAFLFYFGFVGVFGRAVGVSLWVLGGLLG